MSMVEIIWVRRWWLELDKCHRQTNSVPFTFPKVRFVPKFLR